MYYAFPTNMAYRVICHPPFLVSSTLPCHPISQCLTLTDPGCFRQLMIREGRWRVKAPFPPTISKTIVSISIISYMCILLGVLGMFYLEIFLLFYSDFNIKSSENSCKNNIFAILFKIHKIRRILMRI